VKPEFRPGKNIALKVPAHEFERMVHFYGAVLGLERRTDKSTDAYESVVFDFGDKNRWVD
jgi:predicted enzyme related to lactoylglutathione lyase